MSGVTGRLGPLVRRDRILDGMSVEAELLGQTAEDVGFRVHQIQPDQHLRIGQ